MEEESRSFVVSGEDIDDVFQKVLYMCLNDIPGICQGREHWKCSNLLEHFGQSRKTLTYSMKEERFWGIESLDNTASFKLV